MNELQKKLAIVGSTAFIVWFFIGYENSSSRSTAFLNIDGIDAFIWYFIRDTWFATTTFVTWLGSLIAFYIYKDNK